MPSCFDYMSIVQLFKATYFGPDEFMYYVMAFLILVVIGLYLDRTRSGLLTNRRERVAVLANGH
jgi:hypothetical protein